MLVDGNSTRISLSYNLTEPRACNCIIAFFPLVYCKIIECMNKLETPLAFIQNTYIPMRSILLLRPLNTSHAFIFEFLYCLDFVLIFTLMILDQYVVCSSDKMKTKTATKLFHLNEYHQ